jgi:flagellin-specific chaperone FliS
MNPYTTSSLLEVRIRAASPAGLTLILLEQAALSTGEAIRALEDNAPRLRARAVNRLIDILSELNHSLRLEVSSDASRRKRLYLSLQEMVIEGHAKASRRPFEITAAAINSLLEDWRNVCQLLEGAASPAPEGDPVEVEIPRNPYEENAAFGDQTKRRWML